VNYWPGAERLWFQGQWPPEDLGTNLMTYVLATTETVVRWYEFDILTISIGAPNFTLVERLDLSTIPQFREKELAVAAAHILGLKVWRCVQI
jgi:hypothetical protein